MEKKMVVDGDAPYLPQETIRNILKRLPVKSLIRFQCVCKGWKNLFKTPSFIEEHLSYSTQKNDFLLFKKSSYEPNPTGHLCLINRDMQVIEFHKVPRYAYCRSIVGSSNGLLCLKSESFILWNPATRDILQVPQVEPQCVGISLVGFGFSPIVNDYKIVRLPYSRMVVDDRVSSFQVFSLSTRSWKLVEGGKLKGLVHFIGNSLAFGGAIFWVGGNFKHEYCLISFDIATESFTLIPIPTTAHVSHLSTLIVYENKLAVLCNSGTAGLFSINLWVMEKCIDESGEGWIWTKIFTSNPYTRSSACFSNLLTLWRNEFFWEPCSCPLFLVKAMRSMGKVDRGQNNIVLSNLHNNEVKTLAIGKYNITPEVWNYAESLVSLG